MDFKNSLKIIRLATCFLIAVLGVITALIYTTFYTSILLITISSILLVISVSNSYEKRKFFEPITIFNIFYLFIFILRPINIIFGTVLDNDNHVFMIYRNIYGISIFSESQHFKSLLIGGMGQIFTYFGYYLLLNKKQQKNLNSDKLFSAKNIFINRSINKYFMIFTLGLMFIFLVVYGRNDLLSFFLMKNRPDYSTINIIWVQIGTITCFVSIFLHKKITFFTWIVIILMLLLMTAIGQRAYAVNLLLGIIILLYYLRFKKINSQLIIYMFLIIVVVILFGSLRNLNIGRDVNNILLRRVLDEFSMYDMLLVSINHDEVFGGFHYNGYNYLAIFNSFFPRDIWPFWVSQFDHQHTANLFKGLYGGAVPTSIFGSLFLNWGFTGLIIISTLFGVFLKRIRNVFSNVSFDSSAILIYSITATLIYDLIRVGDFGREIWTFMIYLGVYYIMRQIHYIFLRISSL